MPLFQKPLGWLQRFLYNVEQGHLPFPAPVIEVGQDWPLESQRITSAFTTAVGTISPTVYAPGEEKHGLVWTMSSFRSAAGQFPNTDVQGLNFVSREGTAIRLISFEASLALDHVPLIEAVALPAATVTPVWGVKAVYVPPGASLQYIHTSVAGGLNGILLGGVIERLKSYPLRLP